MTLVGDATVSLEWLQRVPLDLSIPFDWISQEYQAAWANGSGNYQANIHFHERRTLAAGASQSYVLDDGSLLDKFANALTFAYLKVLFLYNSSKTVSLKIGKPTTHLWYLDIMAGNAGYSFQAIPPRGLFLASTDLNASDVAGFQQRFQVYNPHASTSAQYDAYLVGVSA